MKRFVLVFFAILFLFTGCAGNDTSKSEPTTVDVFSPNYVSEGQKTALMTLVSTNAMFVEDVFVEKFLPADESKIISDENGSFAPVNSDIFKTYEELSQAIYETYTDEAAKNILAEFDMYKDIYGVLYINTKANTIKAKNYDWSNPEIEIVTVSEGSYEFKVTVKTEKGKDFVFDAKAVTVDGNIRLENIYY
ncbi:MAG: hypothetical protein U0L11_08660 [Acutalibacteraceae bacterium]|nr:hypothetical protein [Acutalibacteraceae bacterium]